MINCQWSDEELDKHLNAEAKKYIADNNIQLYTINAIDKAIEIGMGKRTNTILQSAFFKLADVMPIDDAVEFMKQAAKKSYSKKGDAVVEMNYKAIDAGLDAVHKVEIPDSWKNPVPDAPAKELEGRPEVVKLVKNLLEPISKMDGDSLPVSAFVENPDGQFETGASAYEKRGTAVTVPVWDPNTCIQCNNCAFVCSHATIRPFLLSEDEVKAAPEQIKLSDTKPKAGEYKFVMSVSPLDCMGCGECITVCPKAADGAIKMVPQIHQKIRFHQDLIIHTVNAVIGMMMTYQIAYSCNHLLRIAQFCQQLLRYRRSLLLLQLTAALTEFLLSRLDSNIMYDCRRLQYKLLPGRKLLLFPDHLSKRIYLYKMLDPFGITGIITNHFCY